MRPTYLRAALAVGGGTALASQVHAQDFAAAPMFFGTGQPLTFAATSGQALRSPGIKDDLVKLLFLAAVVVVSTAGAVAAQTSPALPDIEVTNAWARATVGP